MSLSPSVSSPPLCSPSLAQSYVPLLLFGVLWVDLVLQLSHQWDASEQYAYGWFVPFLALALGWRRWIMRPPASPRQELGSKLPFIFGGIVALCALVYLPVRVAHEINSDWALANWLLASMVVVCTLYLAFIAGGWRWVCHFAFPICFILIAVRWPYRIEQGITQGFMRVVATLTVELLGWFNIPALQRGNVIEISSGVVGIDEACSGIRSFQSTLMASLFLGELYLLRFPRRIILLVGGVILAFCFNLARTCFLTWQASTEGLGAIDKWHDSAGMTIFLLCFGSLWLIGGWLKGKSEPVEKAETGAGEANYGPDVAWRRYALLVGCWAILGVVLTEAWYRSHERQGSAGFQWSVALPESKPEFETIDLPARTLELLAFDFGKTAKWREEDGSQWSLFFFRWNPNSVQSVIRSRLHRPERCLPASGLKQVSESALEFFDAGPFKLPFRNYIFESAGHNYYVFFCQWEDGVDKQLGLQASKQAGRLQSVLTGRRRLGQQTFELVLTGYDSMDAASAAVRRILPELVRPDSTTAEPKKVAELSN